jgi:hypothetical protein
MIHKIHYIRAEADDELAGTEYLLFDDRFTVEEIEELVSNANMNVLSSLGKIKYDKDLIHVFKQ